MIEIEDADAYWISPGGEIISNFHIHIEAVIENPPLFALTLDKIKETYAKYKEPLGFEGRARIEIMEALIRGGWIRIRYYPRNDIYSVELNQLSDGVRDKVQAWARGLLRASNGRRKYADVKITEFCEDFQTAIHSVEDVANGIA